MIRRLRSSRLGARISGDLLVVLGLFAALVAFSVFATTRRTEAQLARPYSTHSTAPDGAAALYLWLEELGYQVERIENGPFHIREGARLLFVLSPPLPYSSVEAQLLQSWAKEGGHTLVLVSDGRWSTPLLRRFGVSELSLPQPAEVLTPTLPLLVSPPPGPVEVRARSGLYPDDDDFVAHLQASETPVFVSRRLGEGRVLLITAVAPFTNAGLRDPGSARLVYNLVVGLEPGALVQFDEVHHGYVAGEAENPLLAWLYRSPWGWALIFGGVVIAGWLLLRGWRFGRPVPLPERLSLRPQSEYVVSMAGLFRRAGRRAFVMRHHHDRLKRELAHPWRLNPDLPDDAFVSELARFHDRLDTAALRELLARLSGGRVSEGELVRLIGEVGKWLGT